MKPNASIVFAAIFAIVTAGASANHLTRTFPAVAPAITAMSADEGVPHNLVTAMKADEGVPHNLIG